MEILIGLLIIAVGSFGQSSSYVPIRKVRDWSWESFWLVQGIFAWLVFPLLGALLAVACTYVTAYVLSRPRFKHRYWLMSLFIITWVFDAGIIPQYIIYNQFGFVNSPWVMIVPGAISTQFLIITKTFLEGIPNELEEAAVVDGASDIKILTRVFLPLSPTVLATTGLFYAVSIWNQYLIPQI